MEVDRWLGMSEGGRVVKGGAHRERDFGVFTEKKFAAGD